MKKSFLLIQIASMSFLLSSCSHQWNYQAPDCPYRPMVVQEITEQLKAQQVCVLFTDQDHRDGLITGVQVTCATNRTPISDQTQAEAFVSGTIKTLVDTLEAPENRLYLDEFPLNRTYTTIDMHCMDPSTRKLPKPPYYARIGYDGVNYFTDYAGEKELWIFPPSYVEFEKRSPYFTQIQEQTAGFASRYADQHQLNHYHTGFCTAGRQTAECSFALAGDQQLQLDDAKKLAHDCVSKYVAFITEQRLTDEYFSKIYHRSVDIKGFQPEYVGIRIGFWTKEMNRVMPPYIAEIRFYDNKYHYYQADPETQSLVLVHEELFEAPIQRHYRIFEESE